MPRGAATARLRRNRDHTNIAPIASRSATSTPRRAPVAISHVSAPCPCMNWGSRCSPWTAMTIPLHVSTLTGRSKSQIRTMELVTNATTPRTAPTREERVSTRTRRGSRASRAMTSAHPIEIQARVHRFGSTPPDTRSRRTESKGGYRPRSLPWSDRLDLLRSQSPTRPTTRINSVLNDEGLGNER